MENAMTDDVKKHVRVYISVFIALMALTLITVSISTLHLEMHIEILVALVIASVKASLVAAYFMHLISEKKVIFAALVLTLVFFAALMFLPLSHYADRGL